MTTTDLLDLLTDAITDEHPGARVRTYDEAGVLTRDKGLVVRLPGGGEFRITVQRYGVEGDDDDDE